MACVFIVVGTCAFWTSLPGNHKLEDIVAADLQAKQKSPNANLIGKTSMMKVKKSLFLNWHWIELGGAYHDEVRAIIWVQFRVCDRSFQYI